jgi:hypothetical protein
MAVTQAKPEEWDYAKPFEDMPGPKPLPIIGNVWRFIPHVGKLLFRYVIMGMLRVKDHSSVLTCSSSRIGYRRNVTLEE